MNDSEDSLESASNQQRKKSFNNSRNKLSQQKTVFSRTSGVDGFGYYQEHDEHYVSYKNAVVEWTRYSESRDHNTNIKTVALNPIKIFRQERHS